MKTNRTHVNNHRRSFLATWLSIWILIFGTGIEVSRAAKQSIPDLVKRAEAMPNNADIQFNLGLAYYENGQYQDAIPPLKRALDINTKDQTALVLLGNIYLQLDKISEAESCFKKTLEINPKHIDAYHNLSLVYYKQKRLPDAVTQLQRLLAFQSDNLEAWLNLGLIYTELDKKDEAIQAYRKILQYDTGNEKVAKNLADLLIEKGNYDEVIKLFLKSAETSGVSSDALMYLGLAYLFKDDLKNAQKHLSRSNQINDGKAETHFGIGLLNYRQANLEEAIEELKKALTLRKQYPEALRYLAIAYEDKGEYIKALYYYLQLFKIKPDDPEIKQEYLATKEKAVDYYLRKGTQAFLDNDFKTSIVYWENVLKLNPENENAKKFMASAIAKMGNEIKLHNDKAEAFLAQKRYEEAYSEWDTVLKINPEDERASAGLNRLRLKNSDRSAIRTAQGMNYINRGNVKAALEEFRGTLRSDPNNLIAKKYVDKLQGEQKNEAEKLYRKGIDSFSRGEIREAITFLEQALEIEPKNQATAKLLYTARTQLRNTVKALVARGIELANAGRIAEAKEKFLEVQKNDPGNSQAAEHLGRLNGKATTAGRAISKEEIKKMYYDGVSLYLDGRNRRAIEIWQKILLLDPENQEAKSSIAKAQGELEEMKKRGIPID